MSIPKRLAIKLDETLGHDAAGDLVTLFDEIRTEQRALRADVAEVRQELRTMEARMSDKLQALVTMTSELARGIGALDNRVGTLDNRLGTLDNRLGTLDNRLGTLDKRIDEKHAELIKWSFLFWVGAVAAIAALAGVLRG